MSRFGQPGRGGVQFRLGPQKMPRVIKHLMIATFAAFVVQRLIGISGGTSFLEQYGSLQADQFFRGMVWQPLTRLFLHSELWHIGGNLFILWMFGSSVAERWGYRRFMWLYLGTGVAGGLLQVVLAGVVHLLGFDWHLLSWTVPSLGASGAIYSIMAVYAFTFPDREINLLFVPLSFEAKWLIPIILGLELGFPSPAVSHEAHLLGIFLGWLALRVFGKDGSDGPRFKKKDDKPPRPGHLRVVRGDDGPVYH